jgi:mRNA-degrading endonuclease RelE of RelBE toxin-antitoxin system
LAKLTAFTIVISSMADAELDAMRPFDRTRVLDSIQAHLWYEPLRASRLQKMLGVVPASFGYTPPMRELKVGGFRVFYTVDENDRTVYVLSVRRKPPEMTTEEVLR